MPLSDDSDLVFYYAPQTRAFRVLWFLEELGRPYTIRHVDYRKGEHKLPEFLALNPMGKLPTVVDAGTAIAETGAILGYLADKYSPGKLAPKIGDPNRAGYLRWLFFAAGVMEPAFGEKFFKWDVPASRVAWGSFADMQKTVTAAIEGGGWLAGDTFTAADLYVGSNLHYGMLMQILPSEPPISDYVARCAARPALKRALAMEEEFKAKQT